MSSFYNDAGSLLHESPYDVSQLSNTMWSNCGVSITDFPSFWQNLMLLHCKKHSIFSSQNLGPIMSI